MWFWQPLKPSAAAVTLTSITVSPSSASIDAGDTQAFTATGHYSDSSTADLTATVTWSSDDTGVATIAAGGTATGVAAGTCTITATSGAISGTASLAVTFPVLSGTTLAYVQAATTGISTKWVAAIEGCKYLLTDGPADAVAAAYAGTPWDTSTNPNAEVLAECLFVELQNEQGVDPWQPLTRGGRCRLHVKLRSDNDPFAIYMWRRAHGNESTLTTTLDRTSPITADVDAGSDFDLAPAEAFIGTECVKYSGTTASTMIISQRGMYSPFKTGTGDLYFAQHHRVGVDPTHVQLAPVVSQEPRKWIGKIVALRLHKWDGTSVNSRDDALVSFAGKITSLDEDPNTGCLVIEVRHVLDVVKDTVLFRDQFCGEAMEGLYLQSTGVLKFKELIQGIATVTANEGTITAGYYSLDELYALLNAYLGGELAASRISGYYTWKRETTAEGERSVCHFRIPGSATETAQWFLTMPSEMAAFMGLTSETPVNLGQSKTVGPAQPFRLSSDNSYNGTDEPYRTMAFHFDGPDGPSFQLQLVNERGAWENQRDLLPSGLKYITDGVEEALHGGAHQSWGIFLIDEKALAFGAYDSATHELHDVYLTPWKLANDPDHMLTKIGRRITDQSGPVTIRQILFLEAPEATLINYLFYSTGTLGYNHADYDALPGFGLGLGLPGEMLGSAFEASVAALPSAQSPALVILTEPTKLEDVLAADLELRRASLVWRQGGLVFRRWQTPLVGLATYTLDEETKAEAVGASVNHRSPTREDSQWQRPIVKIDFNRNFALGGDGEFLDSVSLEDLVAADDGGGSGDIKAVATIKARNTFAAFAETGASMPTIISDYLVHMPMLSQPQRRITRSLAPPLWESVTPLDIVLVTDSFARDPLTGQRGMSNRPAVVTRVLYNPGGPGIGGGKPRQAAGQVDLYFLDTHRGAEYGPAADVDETASSSGFSAGYNAATFTLRCQAHQYSEATEAVDASRFAALDRCLLIEKDPTNLASPTAWQVEIASVSGNDITLTAGLASPAWDSTKTYRLVYDDYANVTATQQDHAYQADGTDKMIVDVEIADHYASTHELTSYTANSGTELAEFLPDRVFGDGKVRDVGYDHALANLLNMLTDYKTAHQAPLLSTYVASPGLLDESTVTMFGVIFLGVEQLSTSVQRYLTVAPLLKLDSSHGATSGTVRITFSRDLPRTAQGAADDINSPYWTTNFTTLTWTTSSTTYAAGADQLVPCGIKDGYGMLYVTIECTNAYCQGLIKLAEGPRLYL